MNQAPLAPAPAPTKTSALVIGCIIACVIGGIGLGVYTVISMSRTVKELQSPSDAGPPMSAEEIKALLVVGGSKHDFVGSWESPTGTMAISEDGRLAYSMQNGCANERANGHISVFRDDAFYVLGFRFDIEEAPRRVGDKWRMKVRGHLFLRD